MSDLVKKKDAIRICKMCASPKYRVPYIEQAFENIPTIYAVSEWIPCSESLPSEQGQYLVTFPLCNGEPWVDVLSFCNGKFYEIDVEWGDVDYDDVTAWMPLPKPYGERKGE